MGLVSLKEIHYFNSSFYWNSVHIILNKHSQWEKAVCRSPKQMTRSFSELKECQSKSKANPLC